MEFNLADLFEGVVDTVPDREALVAGEIRHSYAELDARANRCAHHLASVGVGAGDHVAIHAYNRAEWVEAMLGAFKVRAAPININFRYVADELRYVYDNADIVVAVVERQLLPRLATVAGELAALRHVVVLEDGSDEQPDGLETIGYEDALAAASPDRGFGPRSADDHYVLYTGGTTGLPKGVVWRHEDIFNAAFRVSSGPIERPEQIRDGAGNDGMRLMVIPPLMHGGGQWVTFNCFFGTGAGTAVYYVERSFDPHAVWRLAEQEGCHSISLVGDAMGRPLAEALLEDGADYDLSNLFVIGSGGAILSPHVKEVFRQVLPNAVVLDSFGGSETGHTGAVDDSAEQGAGPTFRMNDRTTVLDDDLRPVEPGSGAVGTLARSGHIPLGYYGDEQKTKETFVEVDGTPWVLQGDRATIESDGAITLFGRGSGCINTGGEKVFPEEVETVLRAHPDVYDAVVVGVPDERFVERVAAVVQPRAADSPPAAEALAAHCRAHLSGYKVPRAFVLHEAIQRTPAAKPDYRWAKQTVLDAGG